MHDPPQTHASQNAADGRASSEQLQFAREVIRREGQFLLGLANRLDGQITRAAQWIADCQGSIVVCGVGKAGLVGQKIAATLASTGNRAHFLHPCEALHGDLGRVGDDDIALVLSYSGRTEEIIRLLPALAEQAAAVIAVTSSEHSPLGKAADLVIALGTVDEACPLGLAPTTSTTAMLAAGDALSLLASRLHDFNERDFFRYHPGGSLGLKLTAVEAAMRPLENCRVARQSETVRSALYATGQSPRRSGAAIIVDEDGRLAGIFTDSDLVRLLARRNDAALDRPIGEVMTANCCKVAAGTSLKDSIDLLAERHISELPVIDAAGQPIGLLDITDVVGRDSSTTPAALQRDEAGAPVLRLRKPNAA